MRALTYLRISLVVSTLVILALVYNKSMEIAKNMQDWKQEVELYNLK